MSEKRKKLTAREPEFGADLSCIHGNYIFSDCARCEREYGKHYRSRRLTLAEARAYHGDVDGDSTP